MKLNKLLSALLAAVLLFAAVAGAIPAGAAESGFTVTVSEEAEKPTQDRLKAIIEAAESGEFATTQEMFEADKAAGYLDSAVNADKTYAIYVNRYTGVLYYVNNVTGQILTSNPTEIKTATGSIREQLLSQIEFIMHETANTTKTYMYNSTSMAAERGQISVSAMENGLRVEYVIGETAERALIPGMMTAKTFYEAILSPMLEQLYEITDYDYETENNFDPEVDIIVLDSNFKKAINRVTAPSGASAADKAKVAELKKALILLSEKYIIYNPEEAAEDDLEQMNKKYPITKKGTPIAVLFENATTNDKQIYAAFVTKFCPTYTFEQMLKDEAEVGFVPPEEKKPVLSCKLEYSLNEDNSLSVRFPSNAIEFDATYYTLESLVPLKYFGCGDLTKDGYLFYPDGSGTIINFDDFRDTGILLKNNVYGKDFAYAKITGVHREQINMPVYGVVNEVNANRATAAITGKAKALNGYFAVIEDGEALVELTYFTGGATSKYSNVYCSLNPYASDEVDLSESLGVGNLKSYQMVSNHKYTGDYALRYTILSDPAAMAARPEAKLYEADYVGMAEAYREMLVANGTLKPLENLSANIPLYVESFGSMKIQTKFLTFPVKVSVPLTTFDNVVTMYRELSTAKDDYLAKESENRSLAAQQTDPDEAAKYVAVADSYAAMASEAENITNINFRLTGFANGGMYFIYPTNCRWEKACGGKKGFLSLMSEAKSVSGQEGATFGVYPDFDFMYINNTAAFDGVGNGTTARMIDNRYASKQVYNAVTRGYEPDFTMLVTPAALEKLYKKFVRKYNRYDIKSISVSTIGSDLNSDFNKKKGAIDRQDAENKVIGLLKDMKTTQGYDIMTDIGNAYTWKYVSHILNATVDSSHYRYSSYTVPFTGMVLHGYMNYAGDPVNYAGNPDYSMLRSIENGAALYYILSYQNTMYMKEDEKLNKYYGVDYKTWFDDVVRTYSRLNKAIGDLQDYRISDHKTLIAERVIDASETETNYNALKTELLAMMRAQAADKADKVLSELKKDPANIGRGVKFVPDEDKLFAQFAKILNKTAEELKADGFYGEYQQVLSELNTDYPLPTGSTNPAPVTIDAIDYKSAYSYLTDSLATAGKDYHVTDYTNDNGNVVMVTYSNGTESVSFLLNYNVYAVDVRLADGVHRLGKYAYERIG